MPVPILRIIRTAYYAQALAVILWWSLLFYSEKFYSYFAFSSLTWDQFLWFLPLDILFLIIIPLSFCRRACARKQTYILSGFFISSLICTSLSLLSQSGWLGTGVMIIGLCVNLALCVNTKMFVRSKTTKTSINLLKTFLQSCFIWWLSLYFLPSCILKSFPSEVSGSRLIQFSTAIISVILIAVNLWSGYIMAHLGEGTPLPLDTSNRLVVAGPYAHIRNPMAFTGLGLGFCEALIFLSPALFIYILIASLIWNFIIRPMEEYDLESTFGDTFITYKKEVKCWIQRYSAWSDKKS